MAVTEADLDKVVSKLYDDEQNPGNVTARRLVKKIAPYIGRDSMELEELKEILDPDSVNPYITRDDLKTALLQWTNALEIGQEPCFIEEMSLVTRSHVSDHYTTFSSISSHGYRERIIELQNDLAEKEHLIRNMKRELEYSTQLTQQHEDAFTQMAMERDKLLMKLTAAQNNSNTCDELRQEYTDQLECLNVYKEKCISLQKTIDTVRRDNLLLNTKIANLENEKHSITQQLSQKNEEKEKILCQLSTSYVNLEALMSENVHFKEKITEQQQTIKNLSSIKHSLEVDLQNSINKSVRHMEKDDESDESLTEDLESQLHTEMCVEPRKITRRHSDCSIGKKNVVVKFLQQDNHEAVASKGHRSLMEELQQVPSPLTSSATFSEDGNKVTSTIDEQVYCGSVACEAESSSDVRFRYFSESESVCSADVDYDIDGSGVMRRRTKVCVEKETQTEVPAVLVLENNAVVPRNRSGSNAVCPQHNDSKKKAKRFYNGMLDKFYIWGTSICISYAFLHLYSTMRYCYNMRQGTVVHIYPSDWFSLREILDAIFEVHHTGPTPI